MNHGGAPIRHPRSMRPMLYCYFCGGRVVALHGDMAATKGHTVTGFRCEAESVRWEVSEHLTLYSPYRGPVPLRDAETGRYTDIQEAPA